MSTVGYDLDTSGGLMPLIRALIKPPDEDANAQKAKKPQHPYYKRPGKGHNHDSCDACGEGGDLICCDRCPASFHLGCYDPPLDENDIPAGLWLCKECRGADADKPASSRSSRAQSPVDSKPDEKKTRLLRNKKKSKDDIKEEDDVKDVDKQKDSDVEKELTPMEVLVKAARIMNPRQFELPREMRVPCLFPGTDKEGGKNGNGSVVSVDAQGCVPLPAKACFVCGRTCKAAPLLQCDYCPLLFHQDCLDPPLTALPTGRWMCPNHVEQYIDWKLVNSISATERVALWDKFSGPLDQHAIKVDFIRRARSANPPFRVKVPVGVKGRVIVPDMVRYHYQNPPPLLPSRREYVRCRNALRNLQPAYEDSSSGDEGECRGRHKHAVCLNTTCGAHAEPAPPSDPIKSDKGSESSELSDSDFEYLTAAVKRRRVSPAGAGGPRRGGAGGPRGASGGGRLELRADGEAGALLAAVDEQLEKLDERLVKLLAWQRLQQVVCGEQVGGAWRRAPLSAAAERAVSRSIDRARLARFGFRHVPLPSELLSRTERDAISRAVWGCALSPPPAPASPGHSLSDACVRATLCAVLRPARNGLGDGLGRPIPMRLSRLTIGSDSGCDVVLDATKCHCVSPRHAIIFCDEVTRHFELINYSEWGSRVNGVLYACDLSAAAPTMPGQAQPQPHVPAQAQSEPAAAAGAEPGAEADARARALRDIVRHRMPKPIRLNGSLVKTPHAEEDSCECGASAERNTAGAWEGSALVPHGALLHFGCLGYVFSALRLPEPDLPPAL